MVSFELFIEIIHRG